MLNKNIVGIITKYLPEINYFTIKDNHNENLYTFYELDSLIKFIFSYLCEKYKDYYYHTYYYELKFVKSSLFLEGYNYKFIISINNRVNNEIYNNFYNSYIKGYKYNLEKVYKIFI